MDITTLITTYGIPSGFAIGEAYFIWYLTKTFKSSLDNLTSAFTSLGDTIKGFMASLQGQDAQILQKIRDITTTPLNPPQNTPNSPTNTTP